MLVDGFKSHTNVLFSSSELARREIGYQTLEAQQDIALGLEAQRRA